VPDVGLHSLTIPTVAVLRKVRRCNYPELADFRKGTHLGIAKEIGSVAQIVGTRGFTPFVAGGMLLAGLDVF